MVIDVAEMAVAYGEARGYSSLVRAASDIHRLYRPHDDPWESSPLGWVRGLPSRQRGKVGELLVMAWCAGLGIGARQANTSDCDLIIQGLRIEVKFSTLWASGIYAFQQFRRQPYDAAVCLGISPATAHAWVLPRQLLESHVIGKMGQHGGAKASETDWLRFKPSAPPEWARPYGGDLTAAEEALEELVGNAHVDGRAYSVKP